MNGFLVNSRMAVVDALSTEFNGSLEDITKAASSINQFGNIKSFTVDYREDKSASLIFYLDQDGYKFAFETLMKQNPEGTYEPSLLSEMSKDPNFEEAWAAQQKKLEEMGRRTKDPDLMQPEIDYDIDPTIDRGIPITTEEEKEIAERTKDLNKYNNLVGEYILGNGTSYEIEKSSISEGGEPTLFIRDLASGKLFKVPYEKVKHLINPSEAKDLPGLEKDKDVSIYKDTPNQNVNYDQLSKDMKRFRQQEKEFEKETGEKEPDILEDSFKNIKKDLIAAKQNGETINEETVNSVIEKYNDSNSEGLSIKPSQFLVWLQEQRSV